MRQEMGGRDDSKDKQAGKGGRLCRNSVKKVARRVAVGTAAAAAAYLGTGRDSNAAIIYSAAGFTVSNYGAPGSVATKHWDIDGDGNIEFTIKALFTPTNTPTSFMLSVDSHASGLVKLAADSAGAFRNLPTALVVQQTLAGSYTFDSATNKFATMAGAFDKAKGFSDGVSGYIGFQFETGTGAMGDPIRNLFGWANIKITTDNSINHAFQVTEWAYENSFTDGDVGNGVGVGIKVAAVPEPGSAALLGLGLLAGGIAGVRRWRREKKKVAEV